MPENNEVVDISAVKFNIGESTNDSAPYEFQATIPVEAPVTPESTPAPIQTENKIPEAAVEAPITPPATPESSLTTPVETRAFEPTSDEISSYLATQSNGKVISVDDLKAKIAQWDELDANPALLFKDDHQRKIYDFLSKYQGTDYGTGLQTFAKLQGMNVESLDSKSALKEVYVLENAKMGVSKEKAEQMFEYEYQEKYEAKGEIGQVFEERDAFAAKQKLAAMKSEVQVAPVVEQENPNIKERAKFLEAFDKSFAAPLKDLKVKVSDNPAEDYSFPIQNEKEIKDLAIDYTVLWNKRYADANGYKVDVLKNDIAFLENKDAILKGIFDHGVAAGIERKIKERTNTPDTNTPSNAPQAAAPRGLVGSILANNKF